MYDRGFDQLSDKKKAEASLFALSLAKDRMEEFWEEAMKMEAELDYAKTAKHAAEASASYWQRTAFRLQTENAQWQSMAIRRQKANFKL